MGNRVSTGGSFPFYIFHFLATSSKRFLSQGAHPVPGLNIKLVFVVVFNINIYGDSRMSVE